MQAVHLRDPRSVLDTLHMAPAPKLEQQRPRPQAVLVAQEQIVLVADEQGPMEHSRHKNNPLKKGSDDVNSSMRDKSGLSTEKTARELEAEDMRTSTEESRHTTVRQFFEDEQLTLTDDKYKREMSNDKKNIRKMKMECPTRGIFLGIFIIFMQLLRKLSTIFPKVRRNFPKFMRNFPKFMRNFPKYIRIFPKYKVQIGTQVHKKCTQVLTKGTKVLKKGTQVHKTFQNMSCSKQERGNSRKMQKCRKKCEFLANLLPGLSNPRRQKDFLINENRKDEERRRTPRKRRQMLNGEDKGAQQVDSTCREVPVPSKTRTEDKGALQVAHSTKREVPSKTRTKEKGAQQVIRITNREVPSQTRTKTKGALRVDLELTKGEVEVPTGTQQHEDQTGAQYINRKLIKRDISQKTKTKAYRENSWNEFIPGRTDIKVDAQVTQIHQSKNADDSETCTIIEMLSQDKPADGKTGLGHKPADGDTGLCYLAKKAREKTSGTIRKFH